MSFWKTNVATDYMPASKRTNAYRLSENMKTSRPRLAETGSIASTLLKPAALKAGQSSTISLGALINSGGLPIEMLGDVGSPAYASAKAMREDSWYDSKNSVTHQTTYETLRLALR